MIKENSFRDKTGGKVVGFPAPPGTTASGCANLESGAKKMEEIIFNSQVLNHSKF